jgi:hypothetical protein
LEEDDNVAFSSPETRHTGPGTSWNAGGKAAGTYYYRVKASNSVGHSGWSNVRSVVVQPPTPSSARLYLCCWAAIDEDCYIGGHGCNGASWVYPGETEVWRSGALLVDIAGTTYGFGIAASSDGSTSFEARLLLVQEGGELLLARTNFTASSSQPACYARVVQGIDPAVRINQDKLKVEISHVSGDVGQVYYGVPHFTEAGGSYIDFVVSQAANGVSIISMGQCPLPIETTSASPVGVWRWE